ncbi:hypothetical protein AWENTII_010468 [Aspergillus wentii]|nr:hypothetical protein MW887_009648 [Aspergillus wentii]
MPSPATPHRSSNRGGTAKPSPAKQKPLDIGQPLGLYDTNSVRAKVRKWQQQGGGVVTANDAIYYEEDEENTSTEPKGKSTKDSDVSSSKSRPRSHSTPRKRVISDEHWKLNRSSMQTPPPKLPAPNRISEYTTNDPIASPLAGKKDARRDEKPKPSPASRGKAGATTESSRERRKSRVARDVDSIVGSTIEEEDAARSDKPRSATRSVTADKSHAGDESEWAASEADFTELSKRRARGPESKKSKDSKDSREAKEQKEPKETKEFKLHDPVIPKNGIFGHMIDESRKLFGRPEAPKPAPPRGSKIEAWLSETHDPFVDDDMESDVEIPAPLNTKNRAKRAHRREDSHDRATESEPSPDSNPRRKSNRMRRSKGREELSIGERPKSAEDVTISSKDRSKDAPSPANRKKSSDIRQSRPPSKSIPKESENPKKAPEEKPGASDVDTTHHLSESSEVSGSNAPVPLGPKRAFPSTGGHRLSTIASVESTGTNGAKSQANPQPTSSEKPKSTPGQDDADAEERDQFDPNSLPIVSTQLRRRLTTHDDLISVLSTPNRSRSLRSARSIRSSKSQAPTATLPELLAELSADETKYMRELKTLVGGVIPVLLTCVLSRSESAIAAGLFRPSTDPKDEMNFTKPIVDMGVAIERLKTLHKRIPKDNSDALITWAQGAHKVYRDYLRAWRLGFRDVIVNLAPLEEGEEESDARSLDEGMARDENGDVVDGDGEKVDVAYLLKRPLVRLKYLAKTFKGINMLQQSPKGEEVATTYQALVTEARRRAREERARLEDESAASIDTSRARDPVTLGVLPNVTVDRTRRVRARDFFDLSLYHSSGQVIDCRAELLLRDNVSEKGPGGDLLICEIDHADRWLLLPPMELTCVSARNGDSKGEIVVMIRSDPGQDNSWQELLFLRIDEEDVGFEWVQLLGLNPVPPKISRTQSFMDRAKQRQQQQKQRNQVNSSSDAPPSPKAAPNLSDVDVPIGEKATARTARLSLTTKDLSTDPSTVSSSVEESKDSSYSDITRESDYAPAASEVSTKPSTPILHSRDPRGRIAGDDATAGGLKRSKAKRISRYGEGSSPGPSTPKTPTAEKEQNAAPSPSHRFYDDVKRPGETADKSQASKPHKENHPPKTPVREPPAESPRVSSVPSMDLPLIPKLRSGSTSTYVTEPLRSASDEEFDYLNVCDSIESLTKGKGHSRSNSDSSQPEDDEPPPPPPHRSPSSSTVSSHSNTPVLSPTAARLKRRGSSPLKHEYEPSTASDEYSDSDTSTVRHYEMYSESEYSESDSSDDDTEDELASSLPSASTRDLSKPLEQPATSSLSPSHSVSQGGYRSVPSQPSKSSKTIASVFAWSDKGTWESLLPDECSIIVSPGLIEAYKMNLGSTSPRRDERRSSQGQPVVALELTPLVPIRRGTAIDISIRSPPTERSKITWSNNIMFRSRNPDECEVLYSLINDSRINNPTYIALQNARGPFADQPAPLERSTKSGGSFGWPLRRKSYRASSSPRSLADNSESSVGTMSSAFSALKRFGAGSKMFSIARSTVTSRKDGSVRSTSTGSASNPSSMSGIGRIAAAIKGVDGIGLSNAKIRLYYRETQSKWRDMGAARLTIMPASHDPPRPGTAASGRSDTSGPTDAREGSPSASGSASPRRGVESEKRILICGKTRGEVLLDVCLGESAFERVARTGIAVSIREDNGNGGVPKQGGVTNGSSKIYMVQMKSEAEAAYTFGLVGKLKY